MGKSFDVVVIGTGEAGAAAAVGGVETFHGTAHFTGPRSVQVGADTLDAEHVVVALGAWPAILNIPGEGHLTRSDEFLDLKDLPKHIVFVGGGYLVERSREVGIDIRTNAKVVAIDGQPGALEVTAETDSARPVFEADLVVHAAGRAPQMADLDLPTAGLRQTRFVYPTQASNMAWML